MNQSERLVRNLCDHARRTVEAARTEAVDRDSYTTPIGQLPKHVRSAVETLNELRPRAKEARRVIKAAGYDDPHDDDVIRSLTLEYSARNRTTTRIKANADRRLRKIADLQNTANVGILGRSGAEARPILERLKRDLAAVLRGVETERE